MLTRDVSCEAKRGSPIGHQLDYNWSRRYERPTLRNRPIKADKKNILSLFTQRTIIDERKQGRHTISPSSWYHDHLMHAHISSVQCGSHRQPLGSCWASSTWRNRQCRTSSIGIFNPTPIPSKKKKHPEFAYAHMHCQCYKSNQGITFYCIFQFVYNSQQLMKIVNFFCFILPTDQRGGSTATRHCDDYHNHYYPSCCRGAPRVPC